MADDSPAYGATLSGGATRFTVRSPLAARVDLSVLDPVTGAETRLAMTQSGQAWVAELPGEHAGLRYGYRASGEWAPERGLWFDPAKLLVDPWALELDRRFVQDPALAELGVDTGVLVPRALVPGHLPEVPLAPPRFAAGGLVYEVNVKGFTQLHSEVPAALRGTVAALAHPAVIAHLLKLRVSAVELMPVVAWIDERHLPALGLHNFWGYNPVAPMALDPGICPGGVAELRETVAALHAAGIGVILDVVFNHTGETDIHGGVLSLRGLDNGVYASESSGALINDTGCGNTLDFAQSCVRELALAAMRHFVAHCGVDGFRFDLAPVLARGPGFSPEAPIFAEIAADRWLADRVLIAEPWDIGPGGYQLGHFPANWLEWNDRFRDDVRRFWNRDHADAGVGLLATRLAGSADIFGEQACRSVNFLAAHDGFTLADTVAYVDRHNQHNGEDNRDGHGENFSWNCGCEGPSNDPAVLARRAEDSRALLATLFVSTGTILLTAGDEFGRSQQGNNNAYCQDSAIGWVDWSARDTGLEAYVAQLAGWRADHLGNLAQFPRRGDWLTLPATLTAPSTQTGSAAQSGAGALMTASDWENPQNPGFAYRSADPDRPQGFTIDRAGRRVLTG